MKLKYACIWSVLSLLGACDNSHEGDWTAQDKQEPKPLCLEVQQEIATKDQVLGTSFPSGAALGVFLTASGGTDYDGLAHKNVSYTSDGTAEAQTWAVDPSHPINLSPTTGTAYAYYPYKSGVNYQDMTAIPISNDGTDWMYNQTPSTNLSNLNNTAQFTMRHACVIIRCSIHLGTYVGVGLVNSVKVQCDGFATGAVMDLTVPEVKNLTGTGSAIINTINQTMSGTDIVTDFWAIPTGSPATVTFTVDVDGSTYVATKADFTAVAGAVYPFELTMNAVEAEVSLSSIDPWIFDDKGEVFPAPTN